MLQMGIMMLFGFDKSLPNAWLLLQCTLTALPVLLVPAIVHKKYSDQPWYNSYWLKANVYLFVFGFFGNYFGSEYFFDVLGMVYHYPNATTTLDSSLLGTGKQTVPLIMYCLTHVYFMTYHATANIVLRRLSHIRLPINAYLLFPVFIFVIGYFWAFMETTAMANPLMASSFYYEKMDVMLKYGSAIYATYFIASFPIYYFIDECANKRWNLWQTIAAGMSASMLTMYMLDAASHWVGSL
jgi:cycloeucalenol cycloisomerase